MRRSRLSTERSRALADDAGVFATSASHELARVALEAYPLRFLRAEAVVALSAAPLAHAVAAIIARIAPIAVSDMPCPPLPGH